MASTMQAPNTAKGHVDYATRGLALLCGVALLLLCVLAGLRDELRDGYPGHWQPHAAALRYGDRIPPFRLATTAHRWLDADGLHGRWSLLVFASPWCQPCARELRSLSRVYDRLKDRLWIVPVVEGRSGFVSPEATALRYARANRLPFAMAVDPDETVSAACGGGRGLPYALLIDPTGAVRLASRGMSGTTAGSSLLAESLTAFFAGTTSDSLPMTHWSRLPPAPDAVLTLHGGQRTRLAELWRRGTLVITFLTGADPREAARVEALRRVARAPHVRVLIVTNGPDARPAGIRADDGLLLADRNTGGLFAASGVVRGPVSVILYRGRSVAREAGPQQSGEAFEQELAYAVFLSSQAGDSPGHGGTITRARPPRPAR